MKTAICALAAALALLGAGTCSPSGAASPPPTQRTWAVNLVDAMGWSFGLPDEPQDQDYLDILGGDRTFRIEAETHHADTDRVSVKKYRTFGEFSGSGWVSGVASPTEVHLDFLVPLDGDYRFSAALRLPGHKVRIGDRTFSADAGRNFTRIELGTISLNAGRQEMVVHLPPNGSIDYLDLQAQGLRPIRPYGGWDFDRPLTMDVMAETAAQVLNLEPWLPPGEKTLRFEAENVVVRPGPAKITTIRHLGKPGGGRWLRAGVGAGKVRLSFAPGKAGIYDLSLRVLGSRPLTGTVNERFPFTIHPKPYLKAFPAGTHFFSRDENTVQLQLPPRGGVDTLILQARRSGGRDYRRLVGLPRTGIRPQPAQIDTLLALLAAIGPVR